MKLAIGYCTYDQAITNLCASYMNVWTKSYMQLMVPLVNSLLLNDAIWRHDLCELSISLWEFIWGF